ncbi:MAG: hypothetical protein AAGL17_08780, partial [Cyanobacteria bacterium J06576_12]
PRLKGRNHKGRGGSAKQRQYKKRQKLLMKRLQKGISEGTTKNTHKSDTNSAKKGDAYWAPPFFV